MTGAPPSVPSSAVGLADVVLGIPDLFAGPDGVPVRRPAGQSAPQVRDSDIDDSLMMHEVLDVFVKIFDLSKTEDLLEYEKVWNRIGHGGAKLSSEDRKWSEKTGNFMVFLRWCRPVLQQVQRVGTPLKSETFHGITRDVIG